MTKHLFYGVIRLTVRHLEQIFPESVKNHANLAYNSPRRAQKFQLQAGHVSLLFTKHYTLAFLSMGSEVENTRTIFWPLVLLFLLASSIMDNTIFAKECKKETLGKFYGSKLKDSKYRCLGISMVSANCSNIERRYWSSITSIYYGCVKWTIFVSDSVWFGGQ